MIVPTPDSPTPSETTGVGGSGRHGGAPRVMGRLQPGMSIGEGAAICLDERFNAVARALHDLHESPAGVREVHALRVSTRRATSALVFFGPYLDPRRCRKAKRLLRRLRRAAGAVRACDVQEELLLAFERETQGGASVAAELMTGRVRRDRAEARRELAQRRERVGVGRARRMGERLARTTRLALGRLNAEGVSAYSHSVSPVTMGEAARVAIASGARALIEAVTGAPPGDFEALHEARLQGKRLRYLIEISQPCIDDDLAEACVNVLRKFQDRLGEVNDRHELALRVRSAAEELGLRPGGRTAKAFDDLAAALLSDRDRLMAEYERWWVHRRAKLGVALERICDPGAIRAPGVPNVGDAGPAPGASPDRSGGALADELDDAIAGAIRLMTPKPPAQEAQAS